ncbi:MAG: hypothetical protein QW067_11200 [Thermofilaceae archaeon]
MKNLTILAGFIFEGAFKIGFLQKVAPVALEGFQKNFFDFLKSEGLKEEYIKELQKPIENWNKIGTTITPENAERIYTLITYLLGYYSGFLYAKDGKNIHLQKFEIGEESSEIVWKNADLVYIKDKTLYIVDFKLSGLLFWLKEVFDKGKSEDFRDLPRLPVINPGVPINISLGRVDFVEFVKTFLSLEQILMDLKDVFVEIKGFSQLICYAVDYLTEMGNQELEELCLELLYPVAEPYRARFTLSEKIFELSKYKETIKSIYRSLKSKEWVYDELDKTIEQRKGKRQRIEQKLKEEIQKYLREMKEREDSPIVIRPNSIKEVRDDVGKKLRNFFFSQQRHNFQGECKAIALLHSAGGGKTSTLRNLILNSQNRKCLVFYLSTRKILIEREKNSVEQSKKPVTVIYEDIYTDKITQKDRFVRHTGEGFKNVEAKKGKICKIVDKILEEIREKNTSQIWSFTTIQAVLETEIKSTIKYFEKLLRPNCIKNYDFHFILDEFLGYRNGLYAVVKFIELLLKIKEKKGNAYLYLFDANGYSPELLVRLINEFKSFNVIPDSLFLCNYKPVLQIQYNEIPFEIYAKHGYPAEELYLHKKFILDVNLKEPEKLIKLIGDYVIQNLQKESTAFLYIQDKEIIAKLSEYFNSKEVSNIYITASSRKSQEEINRGDHDVILGTSATSRGLDFSRPHKPVEKIFIVITDWSIEQNLVEIIQAISRARGDTVTEQRPKHIYFIYVISKENLYTIEKITQLVEYQDKDLVSLFYKREQLKQKLLLDSVVQKIIENFLKTSNEIVIVPIPAQHVVVYKSNYLSEIENILNFLEDVYLMESKNQEVAKCIYLLIREILNGIFVYTNDIPENLNEVEYYHPYILVRSKLRIDFDNNRREKIKYYFKQIKSKLKEHDDKKVQEIEKLLNELAPKITEDVNFLIPVYSWVFTCHVLGKPKDEHLRFSILKRVGRGGAVVLGASIGITTNCKCRIIQDQKKYMEFAVIPLGEDYPYKEILSGRFVKFPIEFVYKFLVRG